MFEIELKFPLPDPGALRQRLGEVGSIRVSQHCNRDTYFRHPCRDFKLTGEALRVRREDAIPMVTYKGPKAKSFSVASVTDPGAIVSGPPVPAMVKAREEIEWRLDPGDRDGSQMETLLVRLGFEIVATVVKQRETYRLGGADHAMTITIDNVESLGWYCEIETVLHGSAPTPSEIEAGRDRVRGLARQLGLEHPEPRSYLRMLVQRTGQSG